MKTDTLLLSSPLCLAMNTNTDPPTSTKLRAMSSQHTLGLNLVDVQFQWTIPKILQLPHICQLHVRLNSICINSKPEASVIHTSF